MKRIIAFVCAIALMMVSYPITVSAVEPKSQLSVLKLTIQVISKL